jgi:hypothetical protein
LLISLFGGFHLLGTRSIAKKVVAERYGPEKLDRRDILGSWIRNGLTQNEAEQESMLQM